MMAGSPGVSIRALIRAKLGRCRRCMRWSLNASVFSWVLFAVALVLVEVPAVSAILLGIAVAFTGLLAAHIVVFASRGFRATADHVHEDHGRHLTRREAIRLGARGVLAGLAMTLARPLAARAKDMYDLGCECKKVPVGFTVAAPYDTEQECKEAGIPKAYGAARDRAAEFCQRVFKCVDPRCQKKVFVNTTAPSDVCTCYQSEHEKGKWRAVCDLAEKTECCCEPDVRP